MGGAELSKILSFQLPDLCGNGDMSTHWGLLSVQEHRQETLSYDVEVVKSNAMKNERTPRGSDDQRGLFETS